MFPVLKRHRASAMLLALCAGIAPASIAQSPAPAAPTIASPKQIPVEHFFRKPSMRVPVLSPSGDKIAMLVPAKDGRIGLAVADVATPNKFVGVAQFDDGDVNDVYWVSDNRLVFDAVDLQKALGDQADGEGLYAVDADGRNYVQLIQRNWDERRALSQTQNTRDPLKANHVFRSVLQDGSDDVLVMRYEVFDQRNGAINATLLRLNTRTQGFRRAYGGDVPDGTSSYVMGPDHQLRLAIASDGKRAQQVYWRESGSSNWTDLGKQDLFQSEEATWSPVGVDQDNRLYVRAVDASSPGETTALFRYDIKRRKIEDKPVLSTPGFDVPDDALIFDRAAQRLIGLRYEQETTGVAWLDSGMRGIQAKVDAQLKSTNNLLGCSRCIDAEHLIVTAYSEVQPAVYFLYERATDKLTLIAQARPWIDSRQMAAQDFQRIKARDGMEVPVYVTKPKGKGPWPTVVLVHGGPYLRGVEWRFSPSAQFLASRGYLVVEPEFRGSTGYGHTLFHAGWKQWGLKMQDDITDATRWAIDQGLADKDRIAIAGASYGGYATMMGLVREPELYKAGINWVGVTDIDLMYSIGWSDYMRPESPWVRYGMPVMIGDPSKDAEQLKATSPLQQAARIKRPVLMAYGGRDRRVPLPHGTKMRNALVDAGNKQVEWVEYEREGHGFMLTKNQVDFWSRVERFLAKHLK